MEVVLLIPRDPVIGALMAELVRFAGHRPVFAGADESPAHALTRIRPSFAFVDCDHAAADSAPFRAMLEQAGARFVLFSGARSERELMQIARRSNATAFVLPNGPRALSQVIERMRPPSREMEPELPWREAGGARS